MTWTWIARWNPAAAVGWKALLLRVLAVMALFTPWDLRFEPVSFRLEDLDPALVEAAQARGWDLLNPAFWPTATGELTRLGLFAVGLGLTWCAVALLRRWVQRRFGVGWAFLTLGLGAVGLVVALRTTQPLLLPSWGHGFLSQGLPVWGGWLHTHLNNDMIWFTWPIWIFLAVLMVEGICLGLEAQRGLREAREAVLRSRLAPHFLFNALNTLHAQIETAPREAQGNLERLARLFRQVLDRSERPTVPLGEELAFVEDYLGLEQARLGERLRVRVDVPEELLEAPVPALALQILVENAVKHGVAPREAGGEVRICARAEGRRLTVAVEDPGNGIGAEPGTGTALANLRERLRRPGDLRLERIPEGHQASFSVARG